jgi:hypothetical protein
MRVLEWIVDRFERLTNGWKQWDLNDYAVGCLILQVAGPAILIGIALGAVCGRLVR